MKFLVALKTTSKGLKMTNATNNVFHKTTFRQDLTQIVEAIHRLKETYPTRWQEACQQALEDGELTLSDALSGLITAQILVEES